MPSKAPDKFHSDLPPSSSDKWMQCYAWLNLNRALRVPGEVEETSEAAEEGTLAHTVFQAVLEDTPIPDGISDTMLDLVTYCAEFVGVKVQDLGEGAVCHSEVEVDFGAPFGYHDLTGTSDVILVHPSTLGVFDLKYGMGQVEVDRNTQLLIYLVGAVHKFGKRPTYEIGILQPRGSHPQGPFRTATITHSYLVDFSTALNISIGLNYRGGQAIVGPHCRKWCKALPTCHAVKDHAISLFKKFPI